MDSKLTHLHSELSSFDGSDVTAGSGTDDDEVGVVRLGRVAAEHGRAQTLRILGQQLKVEKANSDWNTKIGEKDFLK